MGQTSKMCYRGAIRTATTTLATLFGAVAQYTAENIPRPFSDLRPHPMHNNTQEWLYDLFVHGEHDVLISGTSDLEMVRVADQS